MNFHGGVLLAGLCVSVVALAHDGGAPGHHTAREKDAVSADRPQRLADGRLHVPKPVQHLLGLRTEIYAETTFEPLDLLGEVVASPRVRGILAAPQPGRLEPHVTAWPLAGQHVRVGEVLAVLRPQMSERERAQRRAAQASIQQKLDLARVNASRMRLQAQAMGDVPVRDNIYLEQAEAELFTQERQFALARETLDGAVLLRAGTEGVLFAVNAKPGDLVGSGAPLFEIASAAHTRVAVTAFDPGLGARIQSAQLRLAPGAELPLTLVGQDSDPARPGWRLLFEANGPAPQPMESGRLLSVELQLDRPPCERSADRVWVHVAPELFEPRAVNGCSAELHPGDRRVVQGAALLDEYL